MPGELLLIRVDNPELGSPMVRLHTNEFFMFLHAVSDIGIRKDFHFANMKD